MVGVYFLKSYKVSKIAMVYDKPEKIPDICMVYTRIIMIFNELRFYCKKPMKLPQQV